MNSARNRLSGLLFRNFGLKLVALLSSALLWYGVASEPTVEIGLRVPVEFHNVPAGLEILTESAANVDLRLRGPDGVLRRLNPPDVHATLDLAGSKRLEGERTLEITAAQIQVPNGVEIVNVNPAYLRVSFDRTASKVVPVNPRMVGGLVSGYGVTELRAEPAEVTVVGPESRVKQVEAATTDPIDASGVVGTMTFQALAFVPDAAVRVARPSQVKVIVTTQPAPAEATAPLLEKTQEGQNKKR